MLPVEHQPTVLVAEDEAPMRGLVETVLKQQDFRVLLASDGEQAIGLYRSNQQLIDVVLLDGDLPKLGGLDVFLDMKAQSWRSCIICQRLFNTKRKIQIVRRTYRTFYRQTLLAPSSD